MDELDRTAKEREQAEGTETAPVSVEPGAYSDDAGEVGGANAGDEGDGADSGAESESGGRSLADDPAAERRDERRNEIREDAAQRAEEDAERIRAEQPRDTRAERAESDEDASDDDLLVGTGTERAPGTGGGGEHPAPAVVRDPNTGFVRQHGEALNTAGDQAPYGDAPDASDAKDAEGRELGVTEPEQVDTDRIDIGTPVEGDAGTPANDQEDDDA